MASITFVFGKNSIISANGHYLKGLEGKTTDDPCPAIHALFELNEKLEKLYLKFISNDNLIIGAERSVLLEMIEDLGLIVVLLMKKFSNSTSLLFKADQEGSSEMEILFHQDFWEIPEIFLSNSISASDNFSVFFEKYLRPALKLFLLEYKTATFDAIITDSERLKIQLCLRNILYPLFSLYSLLFHMQINK